ncbi:hypothetical protein [Elizabethkingia meningoseptica]|uniref:hypothetical protein n=1 Tax=Elizabethkingia meningoseptica TaxID=238 RepID=UPI0038913F50
MNKVLLSVDCLVAITAFGQTADSLNTKSIDEVILTATRKKENIKEVPNSCQQR